MTIVGCNSSCIGTQEVGGLDVPFFQWQIPLQNFCRWHRFGTWLHIVRNTDLWYRLSRHDVVFISSCIDCTYNAFAFHFLCPNWAAARHTGSKSKKKSKLPTTDVDQSRSIGLHEMPMNLLEDGNQRLRSATSTVPPRVRNCCGGSA